MQNCPHRTYGQFDRSLLCLSHKSQLLLGYYVDISSSYFSNSGELSKCRTMKLVPHLFVVFGGLGPAGRGRAVAEGRRRHLAGTQKICQASGKKSRKKAWPVSRLYMYDAARMGTDGIRSRRILWIFVNRLLAERPGQTVICRGALLSLYGWDRLIYQQSLFLYYLEIRSWLIFYIN